ncbi:MAG: hydrogenase iron-sulfur subunit, partial [Planctomycetota bacterium]
LNIADQGMRVVLVERERRLGGLLNRLSTVHHGKQLQDAESIADSLRSRVESHELIDVHLESTVDLVEGYIGNYTVKLRSNGASEETSQALDISTIVVATGMTEIDPSLLRLEQRVREGQTADMGDVVIINCVGSRNEERGCCSVGCLSSVKNALELKRSNPERSVHVLYRDLCLTVEEQQFVEAAKAAGVQFLRFKDECYPVLDRGDERLRIEVEDLLLGESLELGADHVVLTLGLCGDDSVDQVKGLLKVSANPEGFFQEAHIKLGPLDFPSDGISLCGCAKNPKRLKESCEEGIGAAMRVSIPMHRGYIEADGVVAEIDTSECLYCGLCAKQCPYGAIRVEDLPADWEVPADRKLPKNPKLPSLIKALCKGCGLCAADCPSDSIQIVHYSDAQLRAQVEVALANDAGNKVLGFVCHWCALGGVDMAGVSRLQYPTNGRLIRVMCSARVPVDLVELAFDLGAAGVMVAGCEFPTCHYITGNYACEKRMKRVKKRLARSGHDPDRLWNIWCSAADGPKFAKAMTDMVDALGLGSGTKGASS